MQPHDDALSADSTPNGAHPLGSSQPGLPRDPASNAAALPEVLTPADAASLAAQRSPELADMPVEDESAKPVGSEAHESNSAPHQINNAPLRSDSPTGLSIAAEPQPQQLAYSTFLSLLVVLVLIVTIRFTVPPLVESLRYSWYHGQLRAEYDVSGQRLQNVSLSTLSEASELVSQRVGPSVVHINLLETFGDEEQAVQIVGQGSGVILDEQGHILTNEHVIEGAGRIEVALSDGRRIVAHKIGKDSLTDLAVIKVEADGLLPVEWGDSNKVGVGTPVWAVGSPFGLERTVTFGILSGKHRIDLKGTRYDSRVKGTTTYGDLMQSDVAVNPGNSGGPLVNSSGQIIGINTAIVGENYIGISFSIPSNVAKRVAAGLVGEGEVARGWLGVSLSDPVVESGSAAQAPPRGALVRDWARNSDSPAKTAGINPGDIIVKFDDQEVVSHGALMGLVAQTDVGTEVPVEVLRDGQTITLQVTIGRRPAEYNGVERR